MFFKLFKTPSSFWLGSVDAVELDAAIERVSVIILKTSDEILRGKAYWQEDVT